MTRHKTLAMALAACDHGGEMDTKYRHELAKDALTALGADSSDMHIAETIAAYLLCGVNAPVTLALNHNAKAAPCPMRIDRPGLKTSSVAIHNIKAAHAWIIGALTRGYEVSQGKGLSERGPRSIAGERRSIQNRATMTARRASGEDDEIPF